MNIWSSWTIKFTEVFGCRSRCQRALVIIERLSELPPAAVGLAFPSDDRPAMQAGGLAQHLGWFEGDAVVGPAGRAGERFVRHDLGNGGKV